MAVAVGNEALDAVQEPCPLRLVPMGLQHHGLQVAAGIGLGQVHRAGLAARYPGQILGLELLGRELVQRLGAVLQAPDVLETGVGACDHLIRHHEIDEREVQPLVLARQRQPEQAGLTQRLDIAGRARSVLHVIVHDLGTVVIDSLGVRGDHVARTLRRRFPSRGGSCPERPRNRQARSRTRPCRHILSP